jgi:NAD(P)-dependent dehydrogenase (short-subunit alcohol dehydrogenase family)
MKNLEGKIVVVTGAGSGIGRALALQLAAQGAQLALCDVNETNLQKTVDIAAAHGVKVYSAVLDVSKRDAFQTFADNVARALGNASVVINNAGVALSQNVEAMNRQDFKTRSLLCIYRSWEPNGREHIGSGKGLYQKHRKLSRWEHGS